MKKKIVILSVGATVLLILASLSSVIGFTSSQSQNQESKSPLFAIRTARSIHEQTSVNIRSEYLGKGKNVYIFPLSQLTLQSQLDKALKIMYNNPLLVKKLFEKISDFPQVISIFKNYGLSVSDVEQYIAQVKDNPEIVKAQLKDVDFTLLISDVSRPLGLDTSSALGCFITILVLLPIALIIGILIATITLVTCLNIGNCAETIITVILAGLVQELGQP